MSFKKWLFSILFFSIVITFVLYCWIFFTSSSRLTVKSSNDAFLIFISLNILLTLSIILFTQYISISLVNKAADKWEEQICKYCRSEKSKLVCSACDSIQWSSEKGKIFSSIAIFLAHHRWKVINTVLTFFLIGPLLFAVKFHFGEVENLTARRNKINKEIQSIINYSNNIRPKLYYIGLMLEDKSLDSIKLSKEREYLLGNYYEYAWELAEVVDFLKHEGTNKNKHVGHNEAIKLFKQKNLIPKLDTVFFDVIRSISNPIKGSELNKEELKRSIRWLNAFMKAISCSIGEISFNPEINHKEEKEIEIIDGCLGNIKKVNEWLRLRSVFKIKNNENLEDVISESELNKK